jgi:nicotinamide-nucleotide amidase
MKATVITIGDELLIGQIVNTNAAWIGEELTRLGISVTRMVTVSDDSHEIQQAVERAVQESRVVVTTGGLGPTHDDITSQAVALVFDVELELDESIMSIIRDRFESRGFSLPESNTSQAMIPAGFESIVNLVGTAPALLKSYDHVEGQGLLAVLPGVPHEMKKFMRDNVLPRFTQMEGAQSIQQKTLLTVGIGESHLHELLEGVESSLNEGLSLAYLPSLASLRLRLTSVSDDEDAGRSRLEELEKWIRDRADKWIYGEGDDSLEGVLGRMLRDRGMSLAIAESCTGGGIANRITNVPGASEYFVGGVITYSNEVKKDLLGVLAETLDKFGSVSRQTASEMAQGVRNRFGADIGMSVTGILGPGGGSKEKPVGTVWLGISSQKSTSAVKLCLGKDRIRNKERASTAALNLIRTTILK